MERWQLFAEGGLSFDEIDDLYLNPDEDVSLLKAADMGLTAADVAAGIAREATDKALEKQLYDTVMSRFRANETATNTRRQAQRGRASGEKRRGTALDKLHKMLPWLQVMEASNAWAARGFNSSIGASDPHLDVPQPNPWHAHIQIREANGTAFNLAGVVMPGVPGVLIGRNDNVSWGITMAMTDFVDFYVMEPDPGNPRTHYLVNGTSTAYTTRTELIDVYGASPVSLEVKLSVYGPDVSAVLEMSDRHTICMRAYLLDDDTTSMRALLRFADPTITTALALRDRVLSQVRAPGLSLSVTDSAGGLVYAMTGWHPIRPRGHTGRFVTYGNGSFTSTGLVPYAALPTVVNTNAGTPGFVHCANQRLYPKGYAYSLGYDWASALRARYLESNLTAATAMQLGSFTYHRALQLDKTSSYWTMHLRPRLATNDTFGAAFLPLLDLAGNAMLARLLAWDGVAAIGSTEATLLWEFVMEIAKLPQRALDETGFYAWRKPEDYSRVVMFAPTPGITALCTGDVAGGCVNFAARRWNAVAARSLGSARAWGTEVNRLEIRHQILHGTPLQCVFDRGVPMGGDRSSLHVANEGMADLDSRLAVTHVSSMRQLYDWHRPEAYWFVSPAGQNGSPWSRFYLSLLQPFSDDAYHRVEIDNPPRVASLTQVLRN